MGINDLGLEQRSSYDFGLPTLTNSWTSIASGAENESAGASDRKENSYQISDVPNGFSHKVREFIFDFEVPSTILNLIRVYRASGHGFNHGHNNLPGSSHRTMSQSEIQQLVDEHAAKFIPGFRQRLSLLVEMSRLGGIEPVLMTQPLLLGSGTDPQTGVSLETIQYRGDWNGAAWWRVLEAYNDTTREIARENNIKLIDLAQLLPKNSLYYYDIMHFNNEGAEQVANIIFDQLKPFLIEKFPQFLRR